MPSYLRLAAGVAFFFLASFALVSALDLRLLSQPEPWLAGGGPAAAAVGIALLVSDVLLPVPSSLVMIAHGALFGVAGGTFVSLVGVSAGAALAFGLGRRGSALVARLVPEDERRRADRLLVEWGDLAVIVTRPVPILAETVALLAGASPLGFGRFLGMALLGNLAPCLLYALTGHTAARLDDAFLVFGLVIGVATLVWFAGRRMRVQPSAAVRPGPPETPGGPQAREER